MDTKSSANEHYPTYHGLPELAGLCPMNRAVEADWSLEESVQRLKRLHYVLRKLHEFLTSKITAEPIYELKTSLSYHAYLCAEQVDRIRRRVGEMREPPLGLDKVPHVALEQLMDEIQAAPRTEDWIVAVYEVVIDAILESCRNLKRDAHPLADAPTVRTARLIEFEIQEVKDFGTKAIECLIQEQTRPSLTPWIDHLRQCLQAAGGLDGTNANPEPLPDRFHPSVTNPYDNEPKRDSRFRDPFNAGVNPEAFLYDPSYDPQDKTLMMYYKRIRELDVPEMMASILVELRESEPWEFHMEMSRQLWDEARHAMMGEVGFVSIGIDWTKIPINFTWSRNLNLQLNARERHGVLFFIEQGLMPRTGKRYEWEVASESGDPLSKLFQDFDWADEVLHAQIGRRWYVPRYESLQQALEFGSESWSRVLSHWRDYREQGLTEHENWWPDIYRQACQSWQKAPDPKTLAFAETYEQTRADLERIE